MLLNQLKETTLKHSITNLALLLLFRNKQHV